MMKKFFLMVVPIAILVLQLLKQHMGEGGNVGFLLIGTALSALFLTAWHHVSERDSGHSRVHYLLIGLFVLATCLLAGIPADSAAANVLGPFIWIPIAVLLGFSSLKAYGERRALKPATAAENDSRGAKTPPSLSVDVPGAADGYPATSGVPPREGPPESMPAEPIDPSGIPADGIFVSYRRRDSSDVTGRIYDRLVLHFGRAHVFKDVDCIPFGVDFRKHLDDVVSRCHMLLAIIGNEWITIEGRDGVRRLDDPMDYVRFEIETALRRNIPVIPVIVQGASVPKEDRLPEDLKGLCYRNAVFVRSDPDFHKDVDRLISGIERHLRA